MGAADEFMRLVGRISTAEQNVDAATSPADCSAHGDRRVSSTSAEHRQPVVGNHAAAGYRTLPSTAAGRPQTDRCMMTRRLAAIEEMMDKLAALLSKKDDEDEDSQVAADWRRVAAFADRCLFWVFLVITIIYTVTTMIFVPLYLQ